MAEKTQEPPDYSQWLIEILPRHQRLTAGAQSLLENMLKKERIDFLSVTGRTKTTEGALEKSGARSTAVRNNNLPIFLAYKS